MAADVSDYYTGVDGYFSSVPKAEKPLLKSAKVTSSKIEKVLYYAPGYKCSKGEYSI